MRVVCIGGPSGSGKTTVGQLLEVRYGWARMVTATTRPPRPGEVNGIDYHFFTEREFADALASGRMGEHSPYIGNGLNYGILCDDLDAVHTRDVPTYVIINADGLEQLQRYYGDGVLGVYVLADREELANRMRLRGEPEASIERRLVHYDEEVATAETFGMVIDTTHLHPEEVAEEIVRRCAV